MLMKPEAIYHIMADSLRLVLAFLHIKIENIAIISKCHTEQ